MKQFFFLLCESLTAAGGAATHHRPFSGLRRGTFHRRKVPKMRRGLRPPVPLGAPRRVSPEAALRKLLLSTRLSRPILLSPPRLRAGQWNRPAVSATELSSKAARTSPECGAAITHGSFPHDFPFFAVGARIARPRREAAFRGGCGGCKNRLYRQSSVAAPMNRRILRRVLIYAVWSWSTGAGADVRRVKSQPAHSAVNGATVTRPKEPRMVWRISAATYL